MEKTGVEDFLTEIGFEQKDRMTLESSFIRLDIGIVLQTSTIKYVEQHHSMLAPTYKLCLIPMNLSTMVDPVSDGIAHKSRPGLVN